MECTSEQVENPYWRVVLSDIEAYLKYQLLNTVSFRASLPNLNLLLGCTFRSYVEVENSVEAKFCRGNDVVTLLEKGDYRTSRFKAGFHLCEPGRSIARLALWACVVYFSEEDSLVTLDRATESGS